MWKLFSQTRCTDFHQLACFSNSSCCFICAQFVSKGTGGRFVPSHFSERHQLHWATIISEHSSYSLQSSPPKHLQYIGSLHRARVVIAFVKIDHCCKDIPPLHSLDACPWRSLHWSCFYYPLQSLLAQHSPRWRSNFPMPSPSHWEGTRGRDFPISRFSTWAPTALVLKSGICGFCWTYNFYCFASHHGLFSLLVAKLQYTPIYSLYCDYKIDSLTKQFSFMQAPKNPILQIWEGMSLSVGSINRYLFVNKRLRLHFSFCYSFRPDKKPQSPFINWKIAKGDTVQVRTGNNKGIIGKVSYIGLYGSVIKKTVRVRFGCHHETYEKLRISKKTGIVIEKPKIDYTRAAMGKNRQKCEKDTNTDLVHKITYQGEVFL